MAVCAGNAGLSMGRMREIRMHACMATKTFVVDLLRRRRGESEDFGYISARFDVRPSRSVTPLAGDSIARMPQSEMGIGVKALYDVGVACGASVGADKLLRSNGS